MSSTVYPSLMFAPTVARRGVTVAEFNIAKTSATELFSWVELLLLNCNLFLLSYSKAEVKGVFWSRILAHNIYIIEIIVIKYLTIVISIITYVTIKKQEYIYIGWAKKTGPYWKVFIGSKTGILNVTKFKYSLHNFRKTILHSKY